MFDARCGLFYARVAWFTTTVAHLSPRLMLASTLKPDVGFTFKGLRLVSTYVDLFCKPWWLLF